MVGLLLSVDERGKYVCELYTVFAICEEMSLLRVLNQNVLSPSLSTDVTCWS